MKKVLSLSVLALIITAVILSVIPFAYADHTADVVWWKAEDNEGPVGTVVGDTLYLPRMTYPLWVYFNVTNEGPDGIEAVKVGIPWNETTLHAFFEFSDGWVGGDTTGWSYEMKELDPDGDPKEVWYEGDPFAEEQTGNFGLKFRGGPETCKYRFVVYTVDTEPVSKLHELWITIDKTDPIVDITYPENGACIGGNSIWINATAEDPDDLKHTSGIQNVMLYLNDMALPGAMTYDPLKEVYYWHGTPEITETQYNATVVAFDVAGNSESDTVLFIWDNVSHPIEIVDYDIDFYPKPETGADLTIYYDWAGEDGEDPFLKYFEVKIDDGDWIDNGKNYNYTFVDVAFGWHTIYVRYFDCAGNTFETDEEIEVWPSPEFKVEPDTGTVGLETTLTDPETGQVSGSWVTVDGKTMGTEVTVSGCFFAANSPVNVTVYVPTYHWYHAEYGTYELLVASATTDHTGNFITSFWFPTAPQGVYRVTAKDVDGLKLMARFTVVPEVAFKPAIMVGPAVIEVVATGFPAKGSLKCFMFDGTDALLGMNGQVWDWGTDENGTLVSKCCVWCEKEELLAKPGFVMPVLEPGTYEVAIGIYGLYWDGTWMEYMDKCTLASNYVKVVNDFKDLMDAIDDLGLKLDDIIIPGMTEIKDEVAIIETTVGRIEVKLDDLDPIIVDIKDEVATIETVVGQIKVKVDDIQPKVIGIHDDWATVVTKVGTIEGKVTDIDWSDVTTTKSGVATIETGVGNLEAIVPEDLKDRLPPTETATTLSITAVLAAIAAIASIIAVAVLLRRLKVAG